MVFIYEAGNPEGRAIDYERNIIIRRIGMDIDHGFYKFLLEYLGYRIDFGVSPQNSKGSDQKMDINWLVRQLRIPEELEIKRDEIEQLITEGMYTYSFHSWKEKLGKISMIFPKV